jgi:hypothetical protein
MDDHTRGVFRVRLTEFRAEARTVQDIIEHARHHFEDGKFQTACDLISLCSTPLTHQHIARDELMRVFKDELGIEPEIN